MYVKIEPTGCCERKGMVQVRLCMYLEPGDPRYDEFHVTVPIIPEKGYEGEMDGPMPKDPEDYKKWIASLPTQEQDNPFHNHFIYVEPTKTDTEIMEKAEMFLQQAKSQFVQGMTPVMGESVSFPTTVSSKQQTDAQTRVSELKVASESLIGTIPVAEEIL